MSKTRENVGRYEDLEQLRADCSDLRNELKKVIVGEENVVDELLISILCGGHSMLVGVPGLAKTMLVKSLAAILGLSFNRVQFTPDLMPADITGTELIQEDRTTGERAFRFIPGPIFANVVLADEINRTPPKTQAALLEAMQERQVTASGKRHVLPTPFIVLATQNPIEQEGTYPLPEAQLDRFMMEIRVDYPSEDEEFEIVQRQSGRRNVELNEIVNAEKLTVFRKTVEAMPIAEHDVRYAISLVRETRKQTGEEDSEIRKYISWGAGPRASEWLVLAAKGHAALTGRDFATAKNVQAVLKPVLRHRLILNFNAEADGVTVDQLIDQLQKSVPTPAQGPIPQAIRKLISS